MVKDTYSRVTGKLKVFLSSPFSSCLKKKPEPNKDFYKQYSIRGIIGKGGFGTVYSGVRRKDKLKVAIKELSKSKVCRMSKDGVIPLEIALMQQVADVPGVIRLIDYFDMSHSYYIVMERFNSKDLFDFISVQGPLGYSLGIKITISFIIFGYLLIL